jgi:4-amino-4-deoxy-L-arabinose transferase-like glycosyltransferase
MTRPRFTSASAWRVTLTLVATLTALRLLTVFLTPLELYPDEAQYWLWSRTLAWGYYSKPPMVAWLIAASTSVGGDQEAWVRLPAVLAHAGAALALHAAGARLYGGWTGCGAALLYSLMPGVQLSAALMTTDPPMLLFLGLAVWAYAALLRGAEGRSWLAGAGLGAALGLAVLSKYAALYFAAGLLLHAAFDREARARWRPPVVAATLAGLLAAVTPNLLWNARHGFSTVAHTAENAQWSGQLFSLAELLQFGGAQFGVFGILPFAVLALGVVVLALRPAVRRNLPAADRALLCLTLPPLLIVGAQAFISRANANWAVAAFAPGAVLVAAWLMRGRPWRRGVLGATAASQGAFAAVFVLVAISPRAATALGLDNAFKRARGWDATTTAVTARAGSERWTAVTTDDRFLFNAMAYYGRDFWKRPDAPPLRMWVREAAPRNQAEAEAPLTPALARRVLHASLTPDYAGEAAGDFQAWRPLATVSVKLDRKRTRETTLWEARGWRRAPRDPASGRPYARPTAP